LEGNQIIGKLRKSTQMSCTLGCHLNEGDRSVNVYLSSKSYQQLWNQNAHLQNFIYSLNYVGTDI